MRDLIARPSRGRIEPEDAQLTVGHRRHAADHAHRRGLACPVRAEEAERLARATVMSMPSTAVNSPNRLTSPAGRDERRLIRHAGQPCGRDGVRVEEVRHRHRDAACGRQVEVLVRAVRVGVGAERTGDDELGLGESLAEHAHERDRPALPERAGGLAERRRRRRFERGAEPRRRRRSVPTRAALAVAERHVRAVRRIGLEHRPSRPRARPPDRTSAGGGTTA